MDTNHLLILPICCNEADTSSSRPHLESCLDRISKGHHRHRAPRYTCQLVHVLRNRQLFQMQAFVSLRQVGTQQIRMLSLTKFQWHIYNIQTFSIGVSGSVSRRTATSNSGNCRNQSKSGLDEQRGFLSFPLFGQVRVSIMIEKRKYYGLKVSVRVTLRFTQTKCALDDESRHTSRTDLLQYWTNFANLSVFPVRVAS